MDKIAPTRAKRPDLNKVLGRFLFFKLYFQRIGLCYCAVGESARADGAFLRRILIVSKKMLFPLFQGRIQFFGCNKRQGGG